MSQPTTVNDLLAPHIQMIGDTPLAAGVSVVSTTTAEGATVVSTTVFAGDDSGVRSQSSWNDQGFSTVVGNVLDQVVSDLTTAANKAQEIAGDLEQK